MKKVFVLVLVILACAVMPVLAETQLSMATAGTTGTYYALGGEMAALWMQRVEALSVTVQPSGGSADNIRIINNNEADLAIVQNDVAAYAYTGTDAFTGEQIQSFAVLGALFPETVHIIVDAEKEIYTVGDLKGASLSTGAAGSGSFFNAQHILAAYGMTLEDVSAQYLSYGESADAMKNRQLDAAVVSAPIPSAAFQELAIWRDIRLLNLDDEAIDALIAAHPFYTRTTVPANSYQTQTEEVSTVAVKALLVCRADLDEQLAYELTKSLYEHADEISNAKAADIRLENALAGVSTALHPGAERYFHEAGIME